MDILKYNIIAPKIDKTKPRFYKERNCLLIPYSYFSTGYKFYLECSSVDEIGNTTYIILFSDKQVNENFRKLEIDVYGRYRVNLHKDLLEYVKNECERGRENIEVIYTQTEEYDDETYDVYKII